MDLHTLAESLELPDGYRAEIINGSITVSPTPTVRHADIVTETHESLLESGLRDRGLRALQMITVEIAKTGDRYVPDLVVMPTSLARGQGWDGASWIRPAEEVELVVEVVSPSSAHHDWVDKAKGYAQASVPLYLVVDPKQEEVALFRQPEGDEYQEVTRARRSGSVRLPKPFDVKLEVADLLLTYS
ncbi:Uma2 family endonuclease [Nocardiopsis oceani]